MKKSFQAFTTPNNDAPEIAKIAVLTSRSQSHASENIL